MHLERVSILRYVKSTSSGFTNNFSEKVAVITTDGKYFVGILEGFDHLTNLILTETQERVIYQDEESIIEDLGLQVIRGDLVSCVGLVDEELDKQIDWTKVKGAPLVKTKKSIQ
ncbi:Small nuclear ribonucleoprotein-associated protein [Wickerhamomyces ciferrii]|uniref:LSM2-LSM8 complex subunit LSM8 n=1 Tax=Wickerhamomyces ciferrii (strain ATCC 14091 / BCRC 22168 / CBS 111 / JCM 3599 / NBRC 0793 / NRRL Y-1031 F-60-10) TaxID=1206466 RepID=K0KEC8_WICCF|nr:Small nuclear ribonucleoprotein-associated protein [Wickerhamomyces ciferrii]CCH40602.1 Small nuclear ribonucleoprotein-associated protein [Wickerhamomyces ciferrii]